MCTESEETRESMKRLETFNQRNEARGTMWTPSTEDEAIHKAKWHVYIIMSTQCRKLYSVSYTMTVKRITNPSHSHTTSPDKTFAAVGGIFGVFGVQLCHSHHKGAKSTLFFIN